MVKLEEKMCEDRRIKWNYVNFLTSVIPIFLHISQTFACNQSELEMDLSHSIQHLYHTFMSHTLQPTLLLSSHLFYKLHWSFQVQSLSMIRNRFSWAFSPDYAHSKWLVFQGYSLHGAALKVHTEGAIWKSKPYFSEGYLCGSWILLKVWLQ